MFDFRANLDNFHTVLGCHLMSNGKSASQSKSSWEPGVFLSGEKSEKQET